MILVKQIKYLNFDKLTDGIYIYNLGVWLQRQFYSSNRRWGNNQLPDWRGNKLEQRNPGGGQSQQFQLDSVYARGKTNKRAWVKGQTCAMFRRGSNGRRIDRVGEQGLSHLRVQVHEHDGPLSGRWLRAGRQSAPVEQQLFLAYSVHDVRLLILILVFIVVVLLFIILVVRSSQPLLIRTLRPIQR